MKIRLYCCNIFENNDFFIFAYNKNHACVEDDGLTYCYYLHI